MTRRTSMLAWSIWTVSTLSLLVGVVVGRASAAPGMEGNTLGGIAIVGAFMAFGTVGALIASRRPENAVGWIYSAIGLILGLGVLCQVYAHWALAVAEASAPLGVLAAWVAIWYWYPTIGLVLFFSLLFFPDGHLPSPRWRAVAWLAGLDLALVTTIAALGERIDGDSYSIQNPVGIEGLGYVEETGVADIAFAVLLLAVLCAVASIVVRFRRARGEERQQLKWFTFACSISVSFIAAGDLVPAIGDFGGDALFGVAVASLPVAVGIAILRYRLYDIDRIVNLTLVYTVLTAMLGAAYALVSIAGALLGSGVEFFRSDIAVAGATLAVAAAFQPLRRRTQTFVDRRFYRSRYDTTRTVESFNARLRDEIELDSLLKELLNTVNNSLQPVHASLWLRTPERATE